LFVNWLQHTRDRSKVPRNVSRRLPRGMLKAVSSMDFRCDRAQAASTRQLGARLAGNILVRLRVRQHRLSERDRRCVVRERSCMDLHERRRPFRQYLLRLTSSQADHCQWTDDPGRTATRDEPSLPDLLLTFTGEPSGLPTRGPRLGSSRPYPRAARGGSL
jgi:hypothetical protein